MTRSECLFSFRVNYFAENKFQIWKLLWNQALMYYKSGKLISAYLLGIHI